MSIAGAFMGFAVMAIIVGAVGTIVTAIMWGDSDDWGKQRKAAKLGFGAFLTLLFVGATLAGGLG